MTRTMAPTFRDLDQQEARDLLARNHVGRLAYSFHDRVDIEPISYVFADDAIYIRTSLGSKLETLAHSPWVAFEVDEVHGMFEWRSVVVHGTVYVLTDAGSELAREAYETALRRLREALPSTLTARDPTPTRQVVLKLHIATMRGRAAGNGGQTRV